MINEELEALVLADAIGALDEGERHELRRRIDEATPEDREVIAGLYDATLMVAAAAEPHNPPSHLRDRVLAAAREAATYTVRASDSWDRSGIPGIEAKVLTIDSARGTVTLLLKGERGAKYPAHTHSGPEECYVIRGTIAIGDLILRAGDFHHADTDSDHDEIAVLEPAEVLLVAAAADYLPT
jgi:anti-sigma factor ChrR (cupin superfamily)